MKRALKRVVKKQPPQTKKLYLSVREAVTYTGIAEYTIRDLIANKEVPYLKAGKKFLIDRIALRNYLAKKSKANLKG